MIYKIGTLHKKHMGQIYTEYGSIKINLNIYIRILPKPDMDAAIKLDAILLGKGER